MRILHAAYDPRAAYDPHAAFNEVQWNPHTQSSLAAWRVMIADFQH